MIPAGVRLVVSADVKEDYEGLSGLCLDVSGSIRVTDILSPTNQTVQEIQVVNGKADFFLFVSFVCVP